MKIMKYTAVPGYFVHDDEPEGPEFRAKTRVNLGLIDRPYESDHNFEKDCPKKYRGFAHLVINEKWERFNYFLEHLNQLGQGKVEWKLFYLIRHGEGHHNVKEKEVGRAEWERFWSRIDSDGENRLADARLTENGRRQAANINNYVPDTVTKNCYPGNVYSSPLARALETAHILFTKTYPLETRKTRIGRIIVKENLRERFGVHTCDRRNTKSWIKANFPVKFDHGFSEEDKLWQKDRRETEEEVAKRARAALHDIWKHDKNTYIAIAAHSGFIRALYAAIGHRDVWVAPGEMMPVLIRGEVVEVPDKKK
ncbi:phosphoglycerate mutase-like protein [Annulohypoxylon moriforme]|nr:phosphoglycerate mutase-like protein [Annulohypoxylon moriforme]